MRCKVYPEPDPKVKSKTDWPRVAVTGKCIIWEQETQKNKWVERPLERLL